MPASPSRLALPVGALLLLTTSAVAAADAGVYLDHTDGIHGTSQPTPGLSIPVAAIDLRPSGEGGTGLSAGALGQHLLDARSPLLDSSALGTVSVGIIHVPSVVLVIPDGRVHVVVAYSTTGSGDDVCAAAVLESCVVASPLDPRDPARYASSEATVSIDGYVAGVAFRVPDVRAPFVGEAVARLPALP